MLRVLKRDIKLILFCSVIGAAAGLVIWCFLKAVLIGKDFIWNFIPEIVSFPFYTILICCGGGLLIGYIHRIFGEFPEDMNWVFYKIRTNEEFEYRNLPLQALAALIPLIMGSCVGPEAGLVSLVVTIWSWTGSHLKSDYRSDRDFSKIGIAVTLSVLFQAPLFGVFVIEGEQKKGSPEMRHIGVLEGKGKYILYAAAIGSGALVYMILSQMLGSVGAGLVSFESVKLTIGDYISMTLYVICGCVMAIFYQITRLLTFPLTRIPVMIREGIGGLVLGVVCTFVPTVMFCSNKEISYIINNYEEFLPWMLVGLAFLKVFMTNVCTRTGLSGGHFFPLIYGGICLGCGISMLIFGAGDHMMFAAAIVCASLLGGVLHRPLAVTMLIFPLFPSKICIWIFLASAAGDRVINLLRRNETL